MSSILVRAHNLFDSSLAEFRLDQEVLEQIGGGSVAKCRECAVLSVVPRPDGELYITIDCIQCE